MNRSYKTVFNRRPNVRQALLKTFHNRRSSSSRKSSGVALGLVLTLSASSVLADTIIDGGTTVTVPDTEASPWNIGGNLRVGDSGAGTLNIEDGGSVTNTTGVIGYGGGGTGTVTVTGTGSTWTNSSYFIVGRGTGTLNIEDGGSVSNTVGYIGNLAGSTGSATVTGSGSSWTNSDNFYVGQSGTATLSIEDGGSVSNTRGYIGNSAGSSGTVTVTGAGSTWTNSDQLAVAQNGTLNIENGGSVSNTIGYIAYYGGNISAVTVTGAGSNWTNSNQLYIGYIGNGTLNIEDGASVSSVGGLIGSNFGGTGAVTVTGAGSKWTNTGTLTVSIGTLNIEDGGSVSSASTVLASTGTLNLNGTSGARGVLTSSFISKGTGSVAFNWNGGIVRATGNETNFLRSFSSSNIDIQGGGAFVDSNGFNIGISTNLDGAGGLTKQGAGTLTLTGDSIYSGGTTISAGALQIGDGGTSGSITGNVTNDASIAFNRSDALTYAGSISGTGGLNKLGSGNLTLSGVNTYSGGTTVNAGTLSVNGSLVGTTTVNSGAALGGAGSVADVSLASGGILAPGNSIGTLTVNGDLTFGAGSIYRVEADAAGASDKTVVNGNVTLAGSVDVRAASGNYANNTSYTILTHTGTRSGTFDSVTSNLAFLTPSLSYSANAVELALMRNDASFASVTQTRNQHAAAGAVEGLGAGAVYDAVSGLSAAQARTAFDTLSGTQHAAASQVAMNMGRGFSGALMNRAAVAGGRFGGASSLRYAGLDLSSVSSMQGLFASPHQLGRTLAPTVSAASNSMARFNAASSGATNMTGVWFQVLGGKGEVKGDGNGSGSDYSSTAFLAGYDAMLSSDWLMGVAVGYGKTQWDADVPATGSVDTPYAALYGRYSSGPWQIRLNSAYADNRFDTARTVTLGGASSQARSKHSGQEWSAAAEAEYALTKAAGWEVRPLAAIRYAYLDETAFSESGSAAALTIKGHSTQQANLGVGSRFLHAFDSDKGTIELRAMVTHLAGDNDSPVTASFVGSTNTFNVDGTPLRRTALVLGAGLSHQLANKLSAYADLGYETRGAGQNNAVAALGIQYRW